MRFVWTDAGDDPSWGIGDKHGINGYFCPLFDEPLTTQVVKEAGARGHVQGVYFGHNWRPGASAVNLVAEVNAEYKRIAKVAPKLRLMWNLEEHDPEFIASVLERWRSVQPNVNTSWSPTANQGSWMHPDFVRRVLACRVRVVPQAFVGNMERVESDHVVRNVVNRGFPLNVVSVFYDAAQLGHWWDGYAFTMGRLPA